MNPRKKAKELVARMFCGFRFGIEIHAAKELAIIAVDELIKDSRFESPNFRCRYWQEVKQQIEQL